MRPIVIALGLLVASCFGGEAATTTAATTSITAPDSEEIARAFVEAWIVDDRAMMESLAEPAVLAQADAIADLRAEEWVFHHCEGAAGTVFCVWAAGAEELVVGVRNVEEPHLVTSFALADV